VYLIYIIDHMYQLFNKSKKLCFIKKIGENILQQTYVAAESMYFPVIGLHLKSQIGKILRLSIKDYYLYTI
jgi:hypothetical protein